MIVEAKKLRNKKFVFKNREEAGKILGKFVKRYTKPEIVLAIPAGGVPVGKLVAKALNCKFGIIIVKKLTFPTNPEAGFGAISFDGTLVLNRALSSALNKKTIERVKKLTQKKIEERIRKLNFKFLPPKNKNVLLVDDGLATGFTMLCAIETLKKYCPKKVEVAIPTANPEALHLVESKVNKIFCLNVREEEIFAVADAYKEWKDLSEEEVLEWLKEKQMF